jgi:hypothetical protein
MLLYPLEEQFDLPPLTIELGDGQRGQREVVGEEDQLFAGLRVLEANPPQWCLEALPGIEDSGVTV